MSIPSNFLTTILPKIQSAQASFNEKDAKKFQLNLLERITKRVESFSLECGQCQTHKQEITEITNQLSGLPYTPKEVQKDYKKKLQKIVQHLHKEHKLIKQGQYLGMGMSFGVAFGAAFNVALDNGAGIALGLVLGLAIGSALEAKAKKEGRVI